MNEITIRVDENDGDYLTAINNISDAALKKLMPLIEAIKKFKSYKWKDNDKDFPMTHIHNHNYPNGEMIREDLGEKEPQELYEFNESLFELFEEYCPQPEHGFHTIESIVVCPKRKKKRLL